MADIFKFDPTKKRTKRTKPAESVATEEVSGERKPVFFDNGIDAEYVEAVIGSENIMLAFATVLLMLRQISTDGDLAINIDENGVHFNSTNSINTEDPEFGMQANTAVNKQAYMFLTDMVTGKDIPPTEISATLEHVMRSLIIYDDTVEVFEYDDSDDTE